MKCNKQRRNALILSVLFLTITLASLFYIAKESKHDCTGEDCPICAVMQQAEQVIKEFGTGAAAPAVFTVIVLLLSAVVYGYVMEMVCPTPVDRRVRMNN